MFKVVVDEIRVDLGFDIFVDCIEGVGSELITTKSEIELIAELRDFIKSRNGQAVESSSEAIVIDTTDLTLKISIETESILKNDEFDNWNDYFFAELSAE